MTVPGGPAPQSITRLEQEIGQLRRDFEEAQRKTLQSAAIGSGGLRIHNGGSLTMEGPGGLKLFYIGPDANGKQVFEARRDNGSLVMRVYTLVGGSQFWALYDRQGNILASDDAVSGFGMASPWISFAMYPLFSMAASSVYGYMNLPVASVTSETILWQGRIPQLTHGFVDIDGIWGQASGSNNTTYRLKLNGTTYGTWTQNGTFVAGNQGPFDVHTLLNFQWINVSLTVQSSGTGSVAVQVLGATCRGS